MSQKKRIEDASPGFLDGLHAFIEESNNVSWKKRRTDFVPDDKSALEYIDIYEDGEWKRVVDRRRNYAAAEADAARV